MMNIFQKVFWLNEKISSGSVERFQNPTKDIHRQNRKIKLSQSLKFFAITKQKVQPKLQFPDLITSPTGYSFFMFVSSK